MRKEDLERYLAEGLSLEQIGKRVGRHSSTVSYHLKKYGLTAAHAAIYAPRGTQVAKAELVNLLAEGASLSEIGDRLGLSVSTVRYWLNKHDLTPTGLGRSRAKSALARRRGLTRIEKHCRHHGPTTFILENRGYYRCVKCRAEAVSNQRRRAKRRLIESAGGACALCGYERYQGALQFHHVDPSQKEFVISRQGVTRRFSEVAAEAAKCVLLCANCHAEVEAGFASLPRSAAVATVIDPVDHG